MSEEKVPNRNPGVVASEMKALIPATEAEAISRLDVIISNAAYRAPEIQDETWSELAFWLRDVCVPPLEQTWQVPIVALFTRMTEEQVRTTYGVK